MNGINTAVAAQGTAFTEQHVALLKRYADTAVLVFDQDAAGLKAAIRTARLFLSVGMPVRVARLSAGEDPDSFLLKHGADPFRELISNACSPVRFEVDTLRNVEHDPDSVDAIGRISSSVIETLAGCSNAIFRAHLIQEAADALNLPESALTSELERFEEKLAAREAKRESFAAAAKPVSDTLDTFLHTKEPPNETPDSDMDLVEEWQNDAVEPVIDSLPKELIESAQEIPPVADKDVSLTEKLLCECLVHWIDNSQIVKLVIDNIPVSILEHTFSQAILSAIIETCNSGTDGLTQLRTTAPAPLQQFVCELETMPSKMFGQEFRPEEAVHDAILGVWRAYLQRKRTSLNISDPEALQRRQRISVLLRQLRNWEMGEHVIAVEISAMNVADPHIS